jgi:hypothetical protein
MNGIAIRTPQSVQQYSSYTRSAIASRVTPLGSYNNPGLPFRKTNGICRRNAMKHLGLALILAAGLGLAAVSAASAAPMAGGPVSHAAGTLNNVDQVWFDRFGKWHPDRGRMYGAPVMVAPACRMVQVCNRWGTRCWMKQRCF